MIRVEGIRKVFNARTRNRNEVLKGVSFELPDKGLIAIFGKSGSGKTTLLNIMGGLDKQDKGTLYIDGEDTKGKVDRIRNAKIGFIFQNYYLEAGYTIEQIMRNAMLIAGFKDEKEIAKRSEEVLKLVKMDRYKHKTADALSGGQKQRVAIARALVKGSDIILADEPTGNLDSENTEVTMQILKEISKTQLVVLVTHEVNLIYKYADSHIKLVDGELNEDGELDSEIEVEAEKNNIYVKEEDKRTYPVDGARVNVYGDEIENEDIELFSDEGTIYIRPSKNVKVIDSKSEKKIIFKGSTEDKSESEKINSVPKYEKSGSRRNGKLFKFRDIWKSRANGDEKAYSTGNIFKQIFVFVMATVICFFSFFTTEALSVKVDSKPIKDNTYYLDMHSYSEIRLLKEDLYSNIDFFELNYREGTFSYSNQQSMSAIKVKYAPKSLKTGEGGGVTLKVGEMPKDKEILITEGLAKSLKHELRKDEYQTDGAILLLMLEKRFKISGIVEGEEPYVYMNRQDYVNFLGVYQNIKFIDKDRKFFDDEFINKDTNETVNSYRAEICLYKGETLDLSDNECTVEINRSSTYLMMTDTKEADYKIDSVNRILLHTPQYISIQNSNPVYVREFSLNRDDMNTDIKIYVNENTLERIFAYIAPNLDALDTNTKYYFEINTDSEEQFSALTHRLVDVRNKYPTDIAKLYEEQNDTLLHEALSNLLIFVLITALLLIIYYFIEKSGSIKNSKEYGIYRAIGINKSNLLYKEVILTFKESLINYILSYTAVAVLLIVRYSMMNIEVGAFVGITLVFMALFALVMVLISIIPYLFVLYKTPSAILSKYDI